MTKKIYLTLLSVFLSLFCTYGQVSQTVTVSQPGTLSQSLGDNKTKVTDLILLGTINAQDFQTIKQMTSLKNLDMAGVKIDNNTIPNNAFQGRVMDKIILPESLEHIGFQAFKYSQLSKGLKLPSTLKSIGGGAFAYFKSSSLDFRNCVLLERIDYESFWQSTVPVLDFESCSKLVSFADKTFSEYEGHVILPSNLETIPAGTFFNFKGSVDLPEGLENIGFQAFKYAQLSKDLKLPSTLKSVGGGAFAYFKSSSLDFRNCVLLERIDYESFWQSTVPVLDFESCSKLVSFADKTFSEYEGHVILPSNLETIPAGTFSNFKGSVDLPEGLENIGFQAFKYAQLSKDLKLPSTLKSIGGGAFAYFKSSVLDFKNCVLLERIDYESFWQSTVPVLDFELCSKLVSFADKTFSEYEGHVILPSSLETIPAGTFSSFKGSVDLPASLNTIGDNCFRNSTIKMIDLPSSLKVVGINAFSDCIQLEKIISSNPTPPTLGSYVFAGVDKEACRLEVPSKSINLYGTTDQWKDFLNVKVTIPNKLDVQYTHDGSKFVDYHAVRIGEYYWIDQNFHHYAPKTQWSGEQGFEIFYPMTQARLDKYMPFVYLDPSDYQVDIDDFNTYYGLHYHWYSAAYIEQNGKILVNGEAQSGWGLPTEGDALQLFAMAPSYKEPYVNGPSVTFGLGAHLGDNPLAFDIAPKYPGSPYLTYWFTNSTGATSKEENLGFKFMPAGTKLNANNDSWTNGLIDPYNGTKYHYGDLGDIYHLFYAAGFWLKHRESAYVHDWLDIVKDRFDANGNPTQFRTWHWNSIRFTRRLTDEELGYKLYKNDEKRDIIKLGLKDLKPEGYVELEHGYLRGYYVKYILDNPNPTMTPSDLYYKKEHYTNVYPPEQKLKQLNVLPATQSLIYRTDESVSLYPNPVVDVLNISGGEVEKVLIYDLSGRQVAKSVNSNTISVRDLTRGSYIVKVTTSAGVSTHKIIKK